MDQVANSLEAYAVFCAPREIEPISHPPHSRPPERATPKRAWPVGWMVGAFYGLILGALTLGVSANVDARRVLAICPILLATVMASQALLVARRRRGVMVRVAQGLTTPALALVAASLGGLARMLG